MKQFLILSALVVGTSGLQADESVLQASLTPDIAIHSRTTQINGLSLNMWVENPQYSVNIGFVNGGTSNNQCLAWGLRHATRLNRAWGKHPLPPGSFDAII